MKKLNILIFFLALFLSGCPFFNDNTSNKNSKINSIKKIDFITPSFNKKTKSKKNKPTPKPRPRRKPSDSSIQSNFLVPVPANIADDVTEMDYFTDYSEDNIPEIELPLHLETRFKVFLIDKKTKAIADVTKYVRLITKTDSVITVGDTNESGIEITINGNSSTQDSNRRIEETITAIPKNSSKDKSSGSAKIFVTPVPVCGNGYDRNSLNHKAISGTNYRTDTDDTKCLKILKTRNLYYSCPPTYQILMALHVTQSDANDSKSHYFKQSEEDTYMRTKFPVFKPMDEDSEDGSNGQYNKWCNLLNSVKFAGLTSWRRGTAQEIRILLAENLAGNWPIVGKYITSSFRKGHPMGLSANLIASPSYLTKDQGVFVSCVSSGP